MSLDRRRFLQLTALGMVATVADFACASDDTRSVAALAQPELLSILGDERVRQLGTKYRAATPNESSADALRAAISKGAGFRIPMIKHESLDDQIKDDFAHGRTVLVDGWVLAVTEARQAALYSLEPA